MIVKELDYSVDVFFLRWMVACLKVTLAMGL